MLTYFECRKRLSGGPWARNLYKVRSWYLFGFILLFRRYEQLTSQVHESTPSELA